MAKGEAGSVRCPGRGSSFTSTCGGEREGQHGSEEARSARMMGGQGSSGGGREEAHELEQQG